MFWLGVTSSAAGTLQWSFMDGSRVANAPRARTCPLEVILDLMIRLESKIRYIKETSDRTSWTSVVKWVRIPCATRI